MSAKINRYFIYLDYVWYKSKNKEENFMDEFYL